MGKKIILFGAGIVGKEALKYYGKENVAYFCDNHKSENEICGKKIISFEELEECRDEYDIIISVGQSEYIFQLEKQLEQKGILYDIYDQIERNAFNKLKLANLRDAENNFKDEIEYMIKIGSARMLPYPFTESYSAHRYTVYYDEANGMYYYPYKEKKMYFPKKFAQNRCLKYLAILLAEQDEQSPHRYFNQHHSVTTGDIFLDIGSAEGLSALAVIDVAKKVYLFECDEDWVEALQKTFDLYKDKVLIINKKISDQCGSDTVRLDDLFDQIKDPLFIKADIEGYEDRFLMGGQHVLSRENIKLSLCTYHKHSDAFFFENYLKNLGYKTAFSKGYIFKTWGEIEFVKGVLYAER